MKDRTFGVVKVAGDCCAYPPEGTVSLPTTDADARIGLGRMIVSAGLWAVAGAICTACAWGGGFAFASALRIQPLSTDELREHATEVALAWALIGACCGAVVGALGGFLVGRGQRGSTALAFGITGAVTASVGGALSPLAVANTASLPAVASSSLAWGLAGLLGGLCGYWWRQWTALPSEPEDDDTPRHPEPPGEIGTPHGSRRWPNRGSFVRFAPLLGMSVCSLAGAAFTAPAPVALALLATGLLGLAVAYTLVSQEQRIRDLERRLRGWKSSVD